MNSSGDSWRLARLIRQNVATRRSGVIWSVSAKASIAYSPRIRKVFSRSKNCASACRSYDDANRPAMPNCRRLPSLSHPRSLPAPPLNTFLTRLRSSASALDVSERQRIMRLLVKEVLVGDDKPFAGRPRGWATIRHCIPLPNRSGDGPPDGGINTAPPEGYLLRSRSPVAVAVQHRAR
jgi:site-specific DNA recombinase